MFFFQVVLPALEHTSGDVRDPASRLVLELYKKVFKSSLHFCSFDKETWVTEGEMMNLLAFCFR